MESSLQTAGQTAQYKLDGRLMSYDELFEYCNEQGYTVDTYAGIGSDDTGVVELDTVGALNPENEQDTVTLVTYADDCEYERAKLELKLSNSYCSYSHTAADTLMSAISSGAERNDFGEYEYSDESLRDYEHMYVDKYNKWVRAYNRYGDAIEIDPSWKLSKIADAIVRNT